MLKITKNQIVAGQQVVVANLDKIGKPHSDLDMAQKAFIRVGCKNGDAITINKINELNELIEDLFESKSYIRDLKINEVLKIDDATYNIWENYNFEIPEKNTFIEWVKKLSRDNNF